MKVVTEILQDLEILKRLLKHNANLKIRINYYLTFSLTFDSKVIAVICNIRCDQLAVRNACAK